MIYLSGEVCRFGHRARKVRAAFPVCRIHHPNLCGGLQNDP